MLGNVKGSKGKSFFPTGYELKTGTLVSGQGSVSVPEGCIPLTVYGNIAGHGSWVRPAGTLKDNNGTTLLSLSTSGANDTGGNASAYCDLMFHYGYDFDRIKNVKSFSITGNDLNTRTITVNAWLQKK